MKENKITVDGKEYTLTSTIPKPRDAFEWRYIKKAQVYFTTWLEEQIVKQMKPLLEQQKKVEELIIEEIKKQPCGQCWECSSGIYRSQGYQVWDGKMFCTEKCFKEHRFKMAAPDEQYRKFDGKPLQEIKPI